MDHTSIYLLLAWVTIVLARPQESEDPKICSSYYPGKAIPGLDDKVKKSFQIDTETENLWKTEHLTYK